MCMAWVINIKHFTARQNLNMCGGRPKASYLRCTRMTCNTHIPCHPSAADEAWYWLKRVMRIG